MPLSEFSFLSRVYRRRILTETRNKVTVTQKQSDCIEVYRVCVKKKRITSRNENKKKKKSYVHPLPPPAPLKSIQPRRRRKKSKKKETPAQLVINVKNKHKRLYLSLSLDAYFLLTPKMKEHGSSVLSWQKDHFVMTPRAQETWDTREKKVIFEGKKKKRPKPKSGRGWIKRIFRSFGPFQVDFLPLLSPSSLTLVTLLGADERSRLVASVKANRSNLVHNSSRSLSRFFSLQKQTPWLGEIQATSHGHKTPSYPYYANDISQ